MELKDTHILKRKYKDRNVDYHIKTYNDRVEILTMHCLFTLNDIEKEIWEEIDGKKSIGSIINNISSRYEGDFNIIRIEIIEFLYSLILNNLIEL